VKDLQSVLWIFQIAYDKHGGRVRSGDSRYYIKSIFDGKQLVIKIIFPNFILKFCSNRTIRYWRTSTVQRYCEQQKLCSQQHLLSIQ